jgi:hypothetical protein
MKETDGRETDGEGRSEGASRFGVRILLVFVLRMRFDFGILFHVDVQTDDG